MLQRVGTISIAGPKHTFGVVGHQQRERGAGERDNAGVDNGADGELVCSRLRLRLRLELTRDVAVAAYRRGGEQRLACRGLAAHLFR